ncbi:hypothetical protein AAMO2058_000948700 [Amorphochlora amoebiformis]
MYDVKEFSILGTATGIHSPGDIATNPTIHTRIQNPNQPHSPVFLRWGWRIQKKLQKERKIKFVLQGKRSYQEARAQDGEEKEGKYWESLATTVSDSVKVSIAGIVFGVILTQIFFGRYQRIKRRVQYLSAISCLPYIVWCLDDQAYSSWIPQLYAFDLFVVFGMVSALLICYYVNRASYVAIYDKEWSPIIPKIAKSVSFLLIAGDLIIITLAVVMNRAFYLGIRYLLFAVVAITLSIQTVLQLFRLRREIENIRQHVNTAVKEAIVSHGKRISTPGQLSPKSTPRHTSRSDVVRKRPSSGRNNTVTALKLLMVAGQKLTMRLSLIAFLYSICGGIFLFYTIRDITTEITTSQWYSEGDRGSYDGLSDFGRWVGLSSLLFLCYWGSVPYKKRTPGSSRGGRAGLKNILVRDKDGVVSVMNSPRFVRSLKWQACRQPSRRSLFSPRPNSPDRKLNPIVLSDALPGVSLRLSSKAISASSAAALPTSRDLKSGSRHLADSLDRRRKQGRDESQTRMSA